MKAAVLEEAKKLQVKDIPEPVPDLDEILVKVACCGVCGTDVKLYEGKYTANVPVVLGHEFAGEVIKIGSAVKNIKVGDKIVSDPNESCGACSWCRSGQPCFCNDLAAYGVLRDGGFAEFTKVTEKGAYKIPGELDFESASFAEPVSCAVHCIDKAAIKPGETVLIIGGGPMGQIILQLAQNSGASELILVTRSEWKLALAERFGATHVINAADEDVSKTILDMTNGLGVDIVIEAVGSAGTIEQALGMVKKSGRVVIFGFAPEGTEARFIPFEVLSKELTIMGSWVNPYTFNRALEILKSGKIDVSVFITNRYPLENIQDSLKIMTDRPEGFMKALITL